MSDKLTLGSVVFAPVQPGKMAAALAVPAKDRLSLTTGCHGDHHEPRPYVGDPQPQRPRAFSCYCGKKTWFIDVCPTCGHDRVQPSTPSPS